MRQQALSFIVLIIAYFDFDCNIVLRSPDAIPQSRRWDAGSGLDQFLAFLHEPVVAFVILDLVKRPDLVGKADRTVAVVIIDIVGDAGDPMDLRVINLGSAPWIDFFNI